MRLYEFESKQIFKRFGIPIPKQIAVLDTKEEFTGIKLDYPAMVKANVLIGGQGKAGGIKRVENDGEFQKCFDEISKIKIFWRECDAYYCLCKNGP